MNVTEISGFVSFGPVEILDHKGRKFFCRNGNGQYSFNLPPGIYSVTGNVSRLENPIKYFFPKLPIPERRLRVPELKVEVEPNPHKCTVYFKTGRIVLDPEMAELSKVNLLHILFHEAGHFLYKTEWKCDVFAAYLMLNRGFNPSQCLKVLMHNLSSSNEETVKRGNRLLYYLKRVKTNVQN